MVPKEKISKKNYSVIKIIEINFYINISFNIKKNIINLFQKYNFTLSSPIILFNTILVIYVSL